MELKFEYILEDPKNIVNKKDPEKTKQTLNAKFECSHRGVDWVLTAKGSRDDVRLALSEIGTTHLRDVIKASFRPFSRQTSLNLGKDGKEKTGGLTITEESFDES